MAVYKYFNKYFQQFLFLIYLAKQQIFVYQLRVALLSQLKRKKNKKSDFIYRFFQYFLTFQIRTRSDEIFKKEIYHIPRLLPGTT